MVAWMRSSLRACARTRRSPMRCSTSSVGAPVTVSTRSNDRVTSSRASFANTAEGRTTHAADASASATGREQCLERIGRVLLNLFERAPLLLVDPQELLTQMRVEAVARDFGAIFRDGKVDDLEALAQVHEQRRVRHVEARCGEARQIVDRLHILRFGPLDRGKRLDSEKALPPLFGRNRIRSRPEHEPAPA